ncbi:MAG: radical SAM protein [Candidatus Bathyarchaeia archaeon]|nr:cobalamin-dependent protein [Candidatus Bathyarchaeota archaeon]
MRVTLINPPSQNVELLNIGIKAPPLGLAYLASVLEKNGCEVKIIDALALGLSLSQVRGALNMDQPDIIGITASTPMIYDAYNVARVAKEVCPNSTVVLGGPHPTFLPMETLKECPSADIVCIGEGEETMVELTEAIRRKTDLSRVRGIAFRTSDGKIVKTEPRPLIKDLDSLPFPAWHLLPMDKYTVLGKKTVICHIMSSRGCPFHCIFCSSSRIFGRKHRARSAKNVVDEIEFLISEYNPSYIEFSDDEFTLNQKRVEEICDELKKRGIDIAWACGSRVDTVSRSLLKKMREAGCSFIYYGIESASQRILNFIKKGITIEQIKRAVMLTKEAGIKMMGAFIVGFPDETKEEIKSTLNFPKKLKVDYVQFTIATPYPGTEFYEMIKREGLLLTEDWSQYTTLKPVIALKNISVKELQKLIKKAYISFYMSPRILRENFGRYALPALKIVLKGFLNYLKFWERP